jgi:hypothetical protein
MAPSIPHEWVTLRGWCLGRGGRTWGPPGWWCGTGGETRCGCLPGEGGSETRPYLGGGGMVECRYLYGPGEGGESCQSGVETNDWWYRG